MFGRYKKATMSILGLYYLNKDVFSELVCPSELDKELLIDSIISECAELEVIYPNPDYMQKLIGLWSKRELYNWQKLYNSTQLIYNPIWNVDASITEKENRDLRNTYKGNEDANGDSINAKTGYNSFDLQNTERDTVKNKVTRDDMGTDTGTIEKTTTRGGNIGVTSSQQLIKEEREISTFNIYDYICDSFKRRFCLLIY